jgi:hypothetical protein
MRDDVQNSKLTQINTQKFLAGGVVLRVERRVVSGQIANRTKLAFGVENTWQIAEP